ncbi:response regulator transcription factor [Microbacterium protaetiae]|uniref:Response regulator transcription factor n=1 Tax=Microbacterium protaetiae TaxID=2509458 RepID=A0A4P6EDY2_9MICO|nr:response regulator transcription factor [Microbacterium protaetiae]QAY60354.1 response regulator transcription factor [Microbacterium protaetiae]
MSISVVIVDDHPIVRSGLRAVLTSDGELDVVGEAADGTEAVALCETLRPDVVLCDLRLGEGADGISTTRTLRALDPAPAVVILTTYDTDHDIYRAAQAGAAGYLLKDAAPHAIIRAIRDAAAGRTAWAPELSVRVLEALRSPAASLTAREVEVLTHVAAGHSNEATAKALFLTAATVKTHLGHIYTKLGVDSRTQAVARAREQGILP